MLFLNKNTPFLLTIDTSKADDSEMGIHLGCDGIIQVLFEYIDSDKIDNPIELLRKALANQQNAVIVTLFDLNNNQNNQYGTCLLLEENGTISGDIPLLCFKEYILNDSSIALKNERSEFKQYQFEQINTTAFFEFIQPPISLVVLGAGNDAIPLMKFADILGWDFRIIDRRSTHANKERFPSASQIVVCTPDVALDYIPVHNRTFFVLVIHSYRSDLQMLKSLSSSSLPYIGILGPKKKFDKMLSDFQQDVFELSQDKISTIYSPTGLDIGAETPEEIALSIIAEIQSVLAGKMGGMLKMKNEVIHSRGSLDIQIKDVKVCNEL